MRATVLRTILVTPPYGQYGLCTMHGKSAKPALLQVQVQNSGALLLLPRFFFHRLWHDAGRNLFTVGSFDEEEKNPSHNIVTPFPPLIKTIKAIYSFKHSKEL